MSPRFFIALARNGVDAGQGLAYVDDGGTREAPQGGGHIGIGGGLTQKLHHRIETLKRVMDDQIQRLVDFAKTAAANGMAEKTLVAVIVARRIEFESAIAHELGLQLRLQLGRLRLQIDADAGENVGQRLDIGGQVRGSRVVAVLQEQNQWMLIPLAENGINFNKSFLFAFAQHQGTALAQDLLEQDFDDFPKDSLGFRNKLYQLIESSNLEINFNPDNFSNQFQKFQTLNASLIDEQFSEGSIKLFPEAVLGIFPQVDSFLEPDYHELMKIPGLQTADGFFESVSPIMDSNFSGVNQPSISERKLMSVFPIDPWQEHAMREVKRGNSMVVIGPPGTGKSQLISALVSDAISNKRNVLVVSQKRTALDVV